MRTAILFYVSGHGFGHARRVAEVMRALAPKHPDVQLHVRTTAPNAIFSDVSNATYSSSALDSGAVEDNALRINPLKTLRRAAELMRNADEIVASEADFIRRERISLIISDIPFLAGDIAKAAGVPCFAAGNFTWDWIYEPFAAEFPEYAHLVQRIRESYSRMQVYLRLPFSHDVDMFPEVIDTPLVTSRSSRDPDDVLRSLRIDAKDPRPRALIAMRGGISRDVVMSAAEGSRDCLFLLPSGSADEMPENVRAVEPTDGVSFADIVSISDVVVSKFGYGILADCIAAKAALLWPRRSGFREDEITQAEAPRYIRAREIPLPDFERGGWASHLRLLMQMPPPAEEACIDGADVCADIILQRIAQS